MKVETIITLTHEDVVRQVPFGVVCEAMYSQKWNTGRVKRLFVETFNEEERKEIEVLKRTSHLWHLGKGVPDKVVMKPECLLLWNRLATFCASV